MQKYINDFVCYILSSTIYRFTNGCLILAISWRLLTLGQGSVVGLAISTTLSFMPSIFVPFVIKRLTNILSGKAITGLSLFCTTAVSCMIAFLLNSTWLLIISNFLLWFCFFVMETSWEMWFTYQFHYKPTDEIQKFSSITMTANQVSLMLGPLMVGPLQRQFGLTSPFIFATIAYLIAALPITLSSRSLMKSDGLQGDGKEENKIGYPHSLFSYRMVPILLFISLSLVWPCLAMLNMMLPIYVKNIPGASVDYTAWLDGSLSIGMATVGFVLYYLLKRKVNNNVMNYVLIFTGLLGFFSLFIAKSIVSISLIAILLVGISFGGFRILLRSYLTESFDHIEVGKIVSMANALSLPIIAVLSLIYSATVSFVHLVPFICFSTFLIATYMATCQKSTVYSIQ